MASSKVCLVAALCSLFILTALIGGTESASCCMRYRRSPVSCKKVRSYSIQTITGSCDINAIILHLPGRFVCADPSVRWTQSCMKVAEGRRRKIDRILKEKLSDVVN